MAAQGCRRVSKGRAKPAAEMRLFRYAATAGDRAQGQEQRQWGTGGNFTAAQDTTHSKGRGGGVKGTGWEGRLLWIQPPVAFCEPISLTILLQPLSLVPGKMITSSCTWQHTTVTIYREIKDKNTVYFLNLFLYYKKSLSFHPYSSILWSLGNCSRQAVSHHKWGFCCLFLFSSSQCIKVLQ